MKKVVTALVVICVAVFAGYWVLLLCPADMDISKMGETVGILFGGLLLVLGIATFANGK